PKSPTHVPVKGSPPSCEPCARAQEAARQDERSRQIKRGLFMPIPPSAGIVPRRFACVIAPANPHASNAVEHSSHNRCLPLRTRRLWQAWCILFLAEAEETRTWKGVLGGERIL